MPIRFAAFSYHGADRVLELHRRRNGSEFFAIVCPLCGLRAKVDLEKHRLLVDYGPEGRWVTISNRPATCPNPECSWSVLIVDGIAFDVAQNGNGAEFRPESPLARRRGGTVFPSPPATLRLSR